MNRRDFLRTLSIGTGMLIISGCSSGFDNTTAVSGALPTGYAFQELLVNGSQVNAQSSQVYRSPGAAWLSESGHVFVYGATDDGSAELLKLTLSHNLSNSEILRQETLLRSGQPTVDGHTVRSLGLGVPNSSGHWLYRCYTQDGLQRTYWLDHDENSVPVGVPNKRHPELKFGMSFGDFELLDDDSVVMVAGVTEQDGWASKAQTSLLKLSPVTNEVSHQILVRSGETIPSTPHSVGTLGLIDASGQAGRFACQVTAAGPHHQAEQEFGNIHRSFYVHGALGEGNPRLQLLNVPQSAETSPAVRAQLLAGEGAYSARISRTDGRTGCSLNSGPDEQSLCWDDRVILKTGDPTPLGGVAAAFIGPNFGPSGLLFANVARTDRQQELVVCDGVQTRTILHTGLRLGSRTISQILFGLVRTMVDSQGRVLCLVNYDDGAQGLLLGHPV